MAFDLPQEARPQRATLREPGGALILAPGSERDAIPRRALLAFVGLQVGEPGQGSSGVGFVRELAELFAVGLEPAIEAEAEGAFDPLEVAAAVRDLGAAERDGAGAEVLDIDGGRGKGTAVAADQLGDWKRGGDSLRSAMGEAVGHCVSIGQKSGNCNLNPDYVADSPLVLPRSFSGAIAR